MQAVKLIICLMALVMGLIANSSATVLKNAVEANNQMNGLEGRDGQYGAGNLADIRKLMGRDVTVTVTIPATDCGPSSAPPTPTVTTTLSTTVSTETSTILISSTTTESTVQTTPPFTPPFMTPAFSSSTEIPPSTTPVVTSSETSTTVVPPATLTTPQISTTSTPPSAPNAGDHVKQNIAGVIGGLALAAIAVI